MNRNGKSVSEKCCGNGHWIYRCSEFNASVNYDNCTALQPCSGIQTLQYEVKELHGPNSMGNVTVSKNMTANSMV